MINVSPQQYITLGEVVPYLSRVMGIDRTRQTVHNWATRGVERGLNNNVRLVTIKRAGRMYTTRAWVREFVDEIST